MGDGGFWHNGLTSGIGNAVFNKHDDLTVIVDNGYSAATGGQDILSSRAPTRTAQGNHTIMTAVKGVGVKWVKRTHTYDMHGTLKVLREALSTGYRGPKVIIAEGECQLNRQRRVKPLMQKAIKDGQARGARALRRRSGHLHRRSLVHPPVRLPVADGKEEPGSAAHRSGRACRQQLCRLRGVRRGGARGGAVSVVLSCGACLQPVGLGPLPCTVRGAVIGFLQRRSERKRLR